MLDASPDEGHVRRCRIVLGRLFSLMKNADPEAVIIPHELATKKAEEEEEEEGEEGEVILCSCKDCGDQLPKLPWSITKLRKHFPKGKPKRGSSVIFTNYLILRVEEIEDMLLDMKNRVKLYNAKISKQKVQHHDVVKLGCIMQLVA